MNHLLAVKNLNIHFSTKKGILHAVKNLTFHVDRGETLGIVGESGSGKSMTGRAILRLVQYPGEINAKRIDYNGTNLLHLSEKKMRKIRGHHISMVMQDPKYSLNPVIKVGAVILSIFSIGDRVRQNSPS